MSFYVYVHRKKSDNSIFYVGKGHGDRAYAHGRNEFWENIVKKHGYTVEILVTDLLESRAFELERRLIKTLGRRCVGSGLLVNLSEGGEGNLGYRYTDIQREYASKVSKEINSRPEVKAKHSANSKSLWESGEFRKKRAESLNKSVTTPEHRARMSAIAKEICARPEVKAVKKENSRNQMKLRKLAADYYGVHYFKSAPYVERYIREALS